MSFIIPDWGGGDSFSYHEDLEDPSILSSKSSKCLLANLKKKKKRKRTEDNKFSQQIPQPRQIEKSINSLRQHNDALGASQTCSLLFPNKSSELKTDKKKKKKVPKIKGTGDQIYGISKNINSEDTGTAIGNGSTNDNVGLAEQLVIKTCRKKKRKRKNKNKNKYSELNAKQKKEKNTQDNMLSNISSTVNKSVEYDSKADVNVSYVFNSKLLTGARTVGEHSVDNKASCTTKRKKRNKKGISSSMNECKVHSGISSQPSDFTEPDDQMLSGENSEELAKIDIGKRSKNKKKNIGDSPTCVEFMGNTMKNEKLSSTVNIPKKSKQRNQLGNKQNKKNKKMETEDTDEDLIFEADDDDDCDPKFQSDFKTLLKELDFETFHNSQPAKKKKMHLNDKSSVSDMTIVHADKKNFARKEKLSSEDYIDSEHLDSDFEIDNEHLETNRKNRHKNIELIEKNTKYDEKKIGKEKGNIREKKEAKIDACETSSPKIDNKKKMDKNKLAEMLEEAKITRESKPLILSSAEALRQKMINQLAVARFRMVNEALYTSSSLDAVKMFTHDHEAFKDYHAGYQAQVKCWPVNPQDLIVQWLCKKPKEWVVADFGCGEAVLSLLVPQQKVHSLDLVATNSRVTACDMAHTPLNSASVDVVVFCLSLMGTNIKDFIVEANRVLKEGGIMKIAEVESRFGDVQQFLNLLMKFGFHCIQKDTNGKYFFLFEFKKIRKLKKTIALPNIILKPCIYKKR